MKLECHEKLNNATKSSCISRDSSKASPFRDRGLVLMRGSGLVESRQKVGHVGWMTSWGGWGLVESGEKSAMLDLGGCDVISALYLSCHLSKKPEAEVKCQIFYYFILHKKKRKICLTEFFYMRERGPGPSVTAGVSCFLK